jgi:hypothetical protein
MYDYNNIDVLLEIKENPTFENCVLPMWDSFERVVLDSETITKVRNHVMLSIIPEKQKEEQYIMDGGNIDKRWLNGCSGEAVIEKYLNVEFIDWSVGRSNLYDVGDLKKLGLNCGVKTSEFENFPAVHKYPKRNEVIVIKKNENEYYVCGVADQVTLKYYQLDELIKSPNLRAKGNKSGFWGFFRLKQFNTLDELKNICEE